MACLSSMRWFLTRSYQFWTSSVTVEPVVFLYMAAIFMEMSVTQDLIKTKVCLKEFNVTDFHECHNLTEEAKEYLASEGAVWIGYYSATMFFFALITTSYIGSWSDRFSRKIPMFIPTLGSLVAVSTLIMNSLGMHLHVAWLLLSAAISGATGGVIATVATTFSYIADITSAENRTKRVVILEACLYIGGTLGMITGGALHKYLFKMEDLKISSYTVVFFLEVGLLLLVLAYITIKVKELPRPLRPSDANRGWLYKLFNVNHIKDIVHITFKQREQNKRSSILLTLLVSLLVNYTLAVQTSLNFSFLSDKPIFWAQDDYSYYTALTFGISGLALILGIIPISLHWVQPQDTTLALLGVGSKMVGLIMFGLSNNAIMVYSCAFLYTFSEFSIPSLRSILSKLAHEDEKGKLFALMQLLQNLAMLTGSQIFNPLYKATSDSFKGLCFEIVAGLQAFAIGILLFLHVRGRLRNDYQAMAINADVSNEEDQDRDHS